MPDDPRPPFVSVVSHETGLPVTVIVWHIRSVRPIREASVDNDDITRIEYSNGDSLDVYESVEAVLGEIVAALAPVAEAVRQVSEASRYLTEHFRP